MTHIPTHMHFREEGEGLGWYMYAYAPPTPRLVSCPVPHWGPLTHWGSDISMVITRLSLSSLGFTSLEAQSPFLYKPCLFITHPVCDIVLHQQQRVERNKKRLLGTGKVFKVLKSGKRDRVYKQMVLTVRETKKHGVRASGSSGSPVPGPKERLYQCGRGRGGGDNTAKQSAGLWAQMGTSCKRE